jgi:hypothetical protein
MMKIRLRSPQLIGRRSYSAGEVVDVLEPTAKRLLVDGHAEVPKPKREQATRRRKTTPEVPGK